MTTFARGVFRVRKQFASLEATKGERDIKQQRETL